MLRQHKTHTLPNNSQTAMENEIFTFIARYMTLSDEEKQAIVDLSVFRSYPKGALLLKQGECSEESYFVLKGCLRSYYIIAGEERTTALYTESESFAPACTVTKTPSDHFVACVEDSLILISTPALEKAMFEKCPRFETLCRILSEELLAKQQVAFDTFKYLSPEERYVHLLETRPDLVQRVPLQYLASFLGIKPESLSRIRKRVTLKVPSSSAALLN